MIRKILGWSIERTAESDERERRRITMLEVAQQTVEKLQTAAREREKEFVRELTETVHRYEDLLRIANARADGMVSPPTVGILQEELRNLRVLLGQANDRTDTLVQQHHEIAMKESPTLMQQIGTMGVAPTVDAGPFGADYPQSNAAYQQACVGQQRLNRDAILARAREYKAMKFKDDQLAKVIRDGEGFRS